MDYVGGGVTHCLCQQCKCVLGAYQRCWVRRQMMNKPNQKMAITRAGTKVVKNAERDVEPPMPRPSATSELDEDAFPRDEPTLGSLFGSYVGKIRHWPSVSAFIYKSSGIKRMAYQKILSLE